jgi:hypothetical protein
MGEYRQYNFGGIKFDYPGYAGKKESGKSGKYDDAVYLKRWDLTWNLLKR